MESRIQRLFLMLALLGSASGVWAATDPELLELEPLLVREPERREIRVDELDTENFELGAFGGVMSVEDFGSSMLYGVRASYHITEDFFVEGAYGRSELGESSYERLSGGAALLSDSERDLSYYTVSVGWNILPGEAFVGSKWAFRGSLYAVAGAGSANFGGDDVFTISAGLGYRMDATDWLSLHVDVRDLMWESDLLGESETMHNVQFTGGMTLFF